jgi:hypothetical protein
MKKTKTKMKTNFDKQFSIPSNIKIPSREIKRLVSVLALRRNRSQGTVASSFRGSLQGFRGA